MNGKRVLVRWRAVGAEGCSTVLQAFLAVVLPARICADRRV